MAKISCTYQSSVHFTNTYDNTIQTYKWLMCCISNIFACVSELETEVSIDFRTGNVRYKCETLDEFRQLAFDNNIYVEKMSVKICNKSLKKNIIQIDSEGAINAFKQNFNICSEEKIYIINMKEEMQKSEASDRKPTDAKIYIDNRNSINMHNCTDTQERISEEKWYNKIKWQIIAPIFVGVAIAVITFCLGIK